ncbi:phosphate ABC transporter permease PstA [Marinithermus hydrothermalis]|uniref:Phosphate transport system permease protein PstA n=1 Tax=Marinithermus hydrothermalis (strain DSM 14884 / JCM 11576 / T1) TaxID=869210 RepID=F2NQ34_MARHT|nr:phosphate ABC transporter permease PstA [Marinithermus hydrothermalis]AEB11345.1 phosphate ABC transporter, inner membrane subunit PstA [Marinithermus hydrothermalis DSM 14884]
MNRTPLLASPEEQARARLRRRKGALFGALTFLPVVLALGLIAVLLFDVVTGAVSWQVIEPSRRSSGQTFALTEALTKRQVIALELAARGLTEEEIQAFMNDPEAMRKFEARNRVELMWYTEDGPFRWVVTTSRDKRVANYPLLEGWRRLAEIRSGLEPGQHLVLNPWLDLSFFFRDASRTPLMAGIRAALVGTLWVMALTALISIPVGVGAAIYLEEYAPDNRWTRLIEVNLRNLAGVPSIVYGVLGLSLFVRAWGLGPSVLSAALTLSLLIMPVIVIASREAIRAVPNSLRQAAYGLGATRWQVVSRVVLPSAVPGIVTGVILSVARAIGETAPLLLVGAAAFVPFLPSGPLSEYTVIPVQIYSWVTENDPEFAHVASAGILVLLAVLAVLYSAAFYVRRRFGRKW